MDDWFEGYYFCGWVLIEGILLIFILVLSWNGKSIEFWNYILWLVNKFVIGGVIFFFYLFNYLVFDYIYLDLYNGSFYVGNILV